MEQNLDQLLIIFLGIINLGAFSLLLLHLLSNYWERGFERNLQKTRQQREKLVQRQQEATMFLARCIREEPYKTVTHQLSKNLLALGEAQSRLNQQQVILEQTVLDAGGNLLRSILLQVLVLPFFRWRQYQRSEKKWREWQNLEPMAQAVVDAQAEVARVGVAYYDRVQSVGSRLGQIDTILADLWGRGVRGASLEAARPKWQTLQAEFIKIPASLRKFEVGVREDLDPQDVKFTLPILADLERASSALAGQARSWEARIAFLQDEIGKLANSLGESEKIMAAWLTQVLWETHEAERIRLYKNLETLHSFPKFFDIDQVDAFYEQIERLNQAAIVLLSRVQKTIANHQALEQFVGSNSKLCAELTNEVDKLARMASFAVQWEQSRTALTQASQTIAKIGSIHLLRNPERIERDLLLAQSLGDTQLPSLRSIVMAISKHRERYIETREALRSENAKNWLMQTENLYRQVRYPLENFSEQKTFILEMVAEARKIEGQLRPLMEENPAAAVPEGQWEPRVVQVEQLQNALTLFKQSWKRVDQRLIDLKQLENDIAAKRAEAQLLYNDLIHLANLRLLPEGISGSIRTLERRANEVARLIDNAGTILLEDQYKLMTDWVREINASGVSILNKLHKMITDKQARLAELTQQILRIANVSSEKIVNDWKFAVKISPGSGAGNEKTSNDIEKTVLERVQELVALLNNLSAMIEYAEKKLELLRETNYRAERERKVAVAIYGEVATLFEQKWPPTREVLTELKTQYAEADYRWNKIPQLPATFELKIQELQDLEAQYKILVQKLSDKKERAQKDKDMIQELDTRVRAVERALQNRLKDQSGMSPMVISAIQTRLEQIGSVQRNGIRSTYLKSSFSEAAYAQVELDYRTILSEAQQPVQIGPAVVQMDTLIHGEMPIRGRDLNLTEIHKLNGNDLHKVIADLIRKVDREYSIPHSDRTRARKELMGLQAELDNRLDFDLDKVYQRVQALQKISYADPARREVRRNVLDFMIFGLREQPTSSITPAAETLLTLFEAVRRY